MYYVRAYGTNSIGTSYGNEVVFISIPPGQVMDFDDNVYNTVTIGTQVWMRENLKVTHFTNGNNISHVTDKNTWIALTTDGYCWYDNDDNNKDIYGALYNWFTVNTGKLCPTGWHVASDAEWTALETYLGGSEMAGGALKESGNDHWDSPNDATNSSGFTALPGGSLGGGDGSFDYLGFNGAWWSLTESTTELAWYRWMKKQDTEIIRDDANKRYGLSVRCIKD